MKKLKQYLKLTVIFSLLIFSCSTNNKKTNNNLKISFETRGLKIVRPNDIKKDWEWLKEATFEYENVGYFSSEVDRLMIRKNNKEGFIDRQGNIIIPCIYDCVYSFSKGLAAVKKGTLLGIIDTVGNIIIPFQYDYIGTFSEGLLKVGFNNKYGYIDKKGKIVIPLKYDKVRILNDGLVDAEFNGKYGFIDKKGKIVIPFKYDFIGSFSEGLVVARLNGKYGYINKKGKIAIPFRYKIARSFSDSLAIVTTDDFKEGYINKKGKFVISSYELGTLDNSFKEGLALIRKDKMCGYIDKSNKLIIPMEYDYDGNALYDAYIYFGVESGIFKNGIVSVKKNNKWGCIDKNNHIVIPFEYDEYIHFDKGTARVKKNDKFGLIDSSGKVLIPIKYDYVEPEFINGFARVEIDNKIGCINKYGDIKISIIYDNIGYFYENLVIATKNDKQGYLDTIGNIIIPFIFEKATPFYNGIAWVKQNNKWGVIKLITDKEENQADNNPPILTIENNNITETSRGFKVISEGKIILKGTISDQSGVKIFAVNGNQYEGNNYTEIDFSIEISGDANIHISATDSKGNNTEKLYTVVKKENNNQENPPNNINSDKRLALVIGNSDYKDYPLKNPVNDANDMANVLEEIGFDVIKFTDTDFSEMNNAVDEFGEKLKDYTIGLFFYAGHGMQVDGVNYLIPVDASLSNENEVEYKCLKIGIILAKMENITHTNILLLDACRNNPFERSWHRGIKSKGLASINAPSGTFIGFATSPGNVASDGTGKNGIYTEAILNHINKKDLTIDQLFNRVNKTVIEKSNGKQIPWKSSSLSDDFYFNN